MIYIVELQLQLEILTILRHFYF